MWTSLKSTQALVPAYTYSDSFISNYVVVPDLEEATLNQTVSQERYLYRFSFRDTDKLLKTAKGDLNLTFKPVKLSDSENNVSVSSNVLRTDTFSNDFSSFFLNNQLSGFNVFNRAHLNLFFTYELLISNINSYEDIANFVNLPLEKIQIETQLPRVIKTEITEDFLKKVSFNSTTSVTFTVMEELYNVDNSDKKIFCFDVLKDIYIVESTSSPFKFTPDIILWGTNGKYRLIDSVNYLEVGSFYKTRSNLNFITRKFA